MASSRTAPIVRKVKPLLSVNSNEARLRVLSLYKAWFRQVPFIVSEYDIPFDQEAVKNKVREKFKANAHVKDTRVIDMLVIKGQQDLQEAAEQWTQACHLMSKHFKESYEERPKDFMSKFLHGQD